MSNNDSDQLKTNYQVALKRLQVSEDRVKQLEGKLERMERQLLRAENRCDVYQRLLQAELLAKENFCKEKG